MSPERKFVPMSEANTERIRTTATLPFQLHEEVGLNVKRLHVICQVSGFSHLRIRNDPQGETSQEVPQIVGIDRDGTAMAGKAKVKKVPTFQIDYSPTSEYGEPWKQARWQNLTISLNTEEMNQRILLSDESVKNPTMWGEEIHKALKSGTLKAGTRHLVKDFERYEKLLTLLGFTLHSSFEIGGALTGNIEPEAVVPGIAYRIALLGTVMTGLHSFLYGLEKPGEGRRISLFFGPELDRAAALLALTYTQRLAEGITENNTSEKHSSLGP